MEQKDNLNLSVGCVVIKDDKVLLVRHTYGNARGKLLIPGGYCREGELPEEAAVREVFEETRIKAETDGVIAVRTSRKEWYMILKLKYIDGIPTSDNNENDVVKIIVKAEIVEFFRFIELAVFANATVQWLESQNQ